MKDFGYMTEVGSGGVSGEGIAINNSGFALVQNNSVTRVAFGIEVYNNANEPGDSSNTTVSGNAITGVTTLTCSECGSGRAMKLTAEGGALPLRYLTVQNNTANNWGGQNYSVVFPTGLYLLGVQYSTFNANVFDGSTDTRANWGLEVHSSFQGGPAQATHHNTITGNTFRSGPCGGCFDVKFADDGPDQGRTNMQGIADIGRNNVNAGNNTFYLMSWTPGPYRNCLQFAHAFFVYPAGQNFVNRGQSITLAAAGIRPPSFPTTFPITFSFYGPSGSLVTSVQYPGGNDSCVMNQQTFQISPAVFVTPGMYKILATYNDGNSNAQIVDDWIGTGGQQVALDVRDSGSCGDTEPPVFSNPSPPAIYVSATYQCPYATSAPVTYTNPAATDNSPGVTVSCNPPSGSSFAVGSTTVTCTATDVCNNTTNCSFVVNVFSVCLVDNSASDSMVMFNAVTGYYQFYCHGTVIASGSGTLTLNPTTCDLNIHHVKGDRTVDISVTGAGTGTGIASVKKTGNVTVCQIIDSKLTNNTCVSP